MADARYRALISWEAENGDDPKLSGWRVYGSRPLTSSEQLLAEVGRNDRSAEVEVDEGRWIFRVVPLGEGGKLASILQQAQLDVRIDASGLPAPKQPAAADTGVGASEPLQGTAEVEPKDSDDAADRVDVIQGSDPQTGSLIATLPLPAAAPNLADGQSRASVAIPFTGLGFSDTRSWSVVHRAPDGRAGTPALIQDLLPDMDDAGLLELAKIDGATLDHFPAPAASSPWEHDATDGFRLKRIPTTDGMVGLSEWESPAGLLANVHEYCAYLPRGTIESEEIDLGAVQRGILDVYHEIQRASASPPADWPASMFTGIPMQPGDDPDFAGTRDGPDWIFVRGMDGAGKPLHPLRPRIFVKWGTTTPIPSAYVPYRPLMWIPKARYVRLKIDIQDYGLWQVKVPKLFVRLRIKRAVQVGSGSVPGNQATGILTLANDRVTGASPFPNALTVLLTPRTAGRGLAVIAKAPSDSPPNVTVTHFDMAGATPATQTDFDYVAVGY